MEAKHCGLRKSRNATSFFFFYRYGDHRDLHSFPTRRSSDLHEPVRERHREATGVCRAEQLLRVCADRKSTRLNSSHSSISYAVFCLKKQNALQRAEFRELLRWAVPARGVC